MIGNVVFETVVTHTHRHASRSDSLFDSEAKDIAPGASVLFAMLSRFLSPSSSRRLRITRVTILLLSFYGELTAVQAWQLNGRSGTTSTNNDSDDTLKSNLRRSPSMNEGS